MGELTIIGVDLGKGMDQEEARGGRVVSDGVDAPRRQRRAKVAGVEAPLREESVHGRG